MGTRSLTFVYDGAHRSPIINMYRQMDGYPSGHGLALARFLKPIKMVNGISDFSLPSANGAPCLAAQIVAHFKKGVGGIYLQRPSEKDCWQEYEYHIRANEKGITVEVSAPRERIFKGTVSEFEAFCEKSED